jgi:hypothetical protein
MSRTEAPLQVRIPTPGEDRPALSRVGVVAIIGFALGIAWPKLLGARLGPDVPGGSRPPAAVAEVATPGSASAAPGEAPVAPAGDAADAARPTNKQRALLTSLKVVGCRDKAGKKLDAAQCKPLAAERWVEPRLQELAVCPSVIGLEGVMELELDLDFEKKSIRVNPGEKSSFPNSTVRGVLNCAGEELGQLELEKIPHELPRSTLLAVVRFIPPGKTAEPEAKDGAPAASGEGAKGEGGLGTATVTWEKALLRDAPKEGKVVARVAQGGRVKILEQRDEWYLVEKGDTKGWVYRQAIGK